MGIKGLNSLLKKYTPESIKNENLESFSNKNIAIDVSIYAYKYLYNNGNIYFKFIQQIFTLLKHNINPIYIFDGKPPKQKSGVLDIRRKSREKKKNSLNEIELKLKDENLDEIDFYKLQEEHEKISKSLIYITPEIITSIKEILDLLAINYIQAPGEADTVCCQLYKDGIVFGSMSEDFDLLLRGSGILIRDFDIFKETVTTYNLKSILKNLDITYNEFIDLSILCGCDYTNKIIGIGPINALKLIKKYKNIENIISCYCLKKKNIKIPSDFDYIKARRMMIVPENEFKSYKDIRTLSSRSYNYIETFLIKKTMIEKKKLTQMLSTILDPVKKPGTNKISQFFKNI
jgi:flap endonuclease-1